MKKLGQFLSELDFACDVKAVYAEFREEMSVSKAVTEIKREFEDERQDTDDAPLFWLGLAAAMAESNELTDAVKKKALSYFTDEVFVERYGEMSGFTPKDVEEIKAYFDSSTSKAKKVKKSNSSDNAEISWKVGDVYAYPLQSETAKEYGIAGRYMIFHVLEIGDWDGKIYPVFHIYITHDNALPKNVDELTMCIRIPCMPHSTPPMYRYIISLKDAKKSDSYKKMLFVGNFSNVPAIDEKLVPKIMFYKLIIWKNIEWPMRWARDLNLI